MRIHDHDQLNYVSSKKFENMLSVSMLTFKEQAFVESLPMLIAVLGLSGALLVGSIVGYIAQMNDATQKGYEIRTLERRVAALKTESARLTAQLAELESIEKIAGSVPMLGLIDGGPMEYLVPKEAVVAVAR